MVLNYSAVKCENLLHQIGSDAGSIRVNGYSNPPLVGTNVTLECSSPNLVFFGPNMTTCMGNGEWEPDPGRIKCSGKLNNIIASTCMYNI